MLVMLKFFVKNGALVISRSSKQFSFSRVFLIKKRFHSRFDGVVLRHNIIFVVDLVVNGNIDDM